MIVVSRCFSDLLCRTNARKRVFLTRMRLFYEIGGSLLLEHEPHGRDAVRRRINRHRPRARDAWCRCLLLLRRERWDHEHSDRDECSESLHMYLLAELNGHSAFSNLAFSIDTQAV